MRWSLRAAVRFLIAHVYCESSQSGACASGAGADGEQGRGPAELELAVTMLSPEAERVLRYLVEVEELAEAVLADKRQVGGPSAALAPGFGGCGLVTSAVGKRAGSGIWLQRRLAVSVPRLVVRWL